MGYKILDLPKGQINYLFCLFIEKYFSLSFLPATPCLRLRPLKGFLSWHGALQGLSVRLMRCCQNYRETRTPSKSADENLDAFVENALWHTGPWLCQQNRIEKLTRPDLSKLNDKTPYTIMFGPDRCGSDSKLHLIFRHVNPKNRCSRAFLPT